jgi:hypothetical protein
MKKQTLPVLLLSAGSLLALFGCSQAAKGRIYFELNGGSFPGQTFSTDYLEGQSGTPVTVTIPDPVKDGYFFVGWREKKADGSYRTISKILGSDNVAYYYYPYGKDTFYAYFEPLVQLRFDLTAGKTRNGAMSAPLLEATSYSDGILNGYANKTIGSTDYLPTATGDHLTFSYWYTEYPIVSTTDADKQKHYSLDTNGEKGVYEFDKSFGTDSMVFPVVPEGQTFTLYAFWEEDPTITVHYDLDGIEDSSFQSAKNTTITEGLTAAVKGRIGIDLSAGKEPYYYDDQKKRFAGFFLDAEFTKPFYLTSEIGTESLDLYLRWNVRVNVTLDYQGGTLNGKTSETFTYYSTDTLGQTFYDAHKPTKEFADFSGYSFDGEAYDFRTEKLGIEDITLLAVYDEYPTLTLKVRYPDSYAGEKVADYAFRAKAGTDISSSLDGFRAKVTDTTLETGLFETKNGDVYSSYIGTDMPDESMDLYLDARYKSVYTLKTYTLVGTEGTPLTGVEDIIRYFGASETVAETSFGTGMRDILSVAGVDYAFDGYYTDSALSSPLLFPLQGSASFTEVPSFTLYRKETLAIHLTFVASTDLTSSLGILPALPGGKTADYSVAIASLLKVSSYTSLALLNADGTQTSLGTLLPESDSTIVVTF